MCVCVLCHRPISHATVFQVFGYTAEHWTNEQCYRNNQHNCESIRRNYNFKTVVCMETHAHRPKRGRHSSFCRQQEITEKLWVAAMLIVATTASIIMLTMRWWQKANILSHCDSYSYIFLFSSQRYTIVTSLSTPKLQSMGNDLSSLSSFIHRFFFVRWWKMLSSFVEFSRWKMMEKCDEEFISRIVVTISIPCHTNAWPCMRMSMVFDVHHLMLQKHFQFVDVFGNACEHKAAYGVHEDNKRRHIAQLRNWWCSLTAKKFWIYFIIIFPRTEDFVIKCGATHTVHGTCVCFGRR